MKFCRKCGRFFEDETLRTCPDDDSLLKSLPSSDSGPSDPLIDKVLDGRFRVVSLLGRGGMGSVYRAIQTSVEREVALKVILGEVDTDAARRFMREARATSALSNVHTVTTFDFGQDEDGTLYLAMELLRGEPLDALLRRVGALHWRRAARIAVQVAESLAEAHEAGIVHRDLKPANIYLSRMGGDSDYVKVLDFGIAKLAKESLSTNITTTGTLLGTPTYMSPEQARGDPIDARADLYALGVTLYQMVAGRPPFTADNPLGLLMKHCQDPVPAILAINPNACCPPELQGIVFELLEKDRHERLASADDLRRRLGALLTAPAAEGPAPAVPPARPAPVSPTPLPLETSVETAAFGRPRTNDVAPWPLDDDSIRTSLPRRRWRIAALAAALMGLAAGTVAALQTGSPGAGAENPTRPGLEPGVSETAVVEAPAPAAQPDGADVVDVAAADSPAAKDASGVSDASQQLILVDSEPQGADVTGPYGVLGKTPAEIPRPTAPLELTLRRNGHEELQHTLAPDAPEHVLLELRPERGESARKSPPKRKPKRKPRERDYHLVDDLIRYESNP